MNIAAMLQAEELRLQKVNEFIRIIASCGCQHFNHDGFVSTFELSDAERVYFIDCVSKKRIYTHRSGMEWKGFTQGITLKRFVENLRDFIKKGERLSLSYFKSDWGYGIKSPWDYGEDIRIIRDAAQRLGIVK
tara:strand:+ start:216 stop:614 length:399 start_codon:yes stop_codon:yes gene_type:complete